MATRRAFNAAAEQRSLEARWAKLKDPGLRKLVRLIAKAAPEERLRAKGISYLVLVERRAVKVAPGSGLDPADFPTESLCYYLPDPIPAAEVKRACREAGVKPSPAVVEFYSTFGEMRDIEPPIAGQFYLPSSKHLFPWPLGKRHVEGWSGTGAWLGAPVVYQARNGDRVLLHPGGALAWAQGETRQIIRAAPSFSALIAGYQRVLDDDDGNGVFDSWSATA